MLWPVNDAVRINDEEGHPIPPIPLIAPVDKLSNANYSISHCHVVRKGLQLTDWHYKFQPYTEKSLQNTRDWFGTFKKEIYTKKCVFREHLDAQSWITSLYNYNSRLPNISCDSKIIYQILYK